MSAVCFSKYISYKFEREREVGLFINLYLKTEVFLYLTKNPFLCLSVFPILRKFKKSFPSTFIYELILMKTDMNANIMNTQILHLIKYDLRGH